MARDCHGNGSEHCCHVPGHRNPLGLGDGVCMYLEVDTIENRHWVCSLRRKLGSWEAVHVDPGYIKNVHSAWEQSGTSDCGEFTGTGGPQCCYADQYPVTFNVGDR